MRISDWSSDVCSSDLDFEVKGAIIAEQSPGRDRPFLRHFDLREQLLKQLRLSRAELVPLTAAIKAVQCGRIGHQRPANPKRTESARGEWDFLDDISDRYEPANTHHAAHRRAKPEIPVYDPLHRLAAFPYPPCPPNKQGRAVHEKRK